MPSSFPHQGAFDASAVADVVTAMVEKSPTSATTPQAIGSPIVPLGLQKNLVALTTNGAINPNLAADYIITKAGILTETIAAPTAGTDDGKIIEVFSSTNNQHVLTFTGGTLQSGAAGATTATWPAANGAGLRIMAFNAKWILLSNVLVVIT